MQKKQAVLRGLASFGAAEFLASCGHSKVNEKNSPNSPHFLQQFVRHLSQVSETIFLSLTERDQVPVRKVPKNFLMVTGRFSGHKNAVSSDFESLLEKEYMLLLDFDPSVLDYEVQPVKIPVAGIRNGYVPDILVRFNPDPVTNLARKPLLAEIKLSSHLQKYEEKYKPKFAAAEQLAKDENWEFRCITEREIRTQRLANLKFLREYRNFSPSNEDLQFLLETLQSIGEISVDQLLQAVGSTEDCHLQWLPIIWHAVIRDHLHTNLDLPLSHLSSLSLRKDM